MRVLGGEEGGDPPEPPSSPSSYFDESENYFHRKKYSHDFPFLKLDVKFDLQIYDGELNVESWIIRSRK